MGFILWSCIADCRLFGLRMLCHVACDSGLASCSLVPKIEKVYKKKKRKKSLAYVAVHVAVHRAQLNSYMTLKYENNNFI